MEAKFVHKEDYSRTKKGVLLINLGTPDAPTPKAVRRYLREFLSDRRVVEIPPLIWKLILNLIILPIRGKKSAHAYEMIWDKEHNDSPLRLYLNQLSQKMQEKDQKGLIFRAAMRYGNPSIESGIKHLLKEKVNEIIILPLYPQYCSATTASSYDEVYRIAKSLRWQPFFKSIASYHDHPAYIEAISHSITENIKLMDEKPTQLLCSFHGMPKATLEKGDPYHCFAQKTARLVQEKLNWPKENFHVCFQSRFGPAKWLSPSTDDILQKIAQAGHKQIAVFAPGFSMDCLETLEEITIRYQELFIEAGGEKLSYIPCLNASEAAVKLYQRLLEDGIKF